MRQELLYTYFNQYDLRSFEGWGDEFNATMKRISYLEDHGVEDIYEAAAQFIHNYSNEYNEIGEVLINEIISSNYDFQALLQKLENDLYQRNNDEDWDAVICACDYVS
jgi:hypothetical protein